MKKQREDYEKAIEAVNNLTKQLDTAMLVSTNVSFVVVDQHVQFGAST